MRRVVIALAALLLLLCAGCGEPAVPADASSAPVSSDPERLIDRDITEVLTAAQASEALGVPMTADEPLDYGTQWRMESEDGAYILDLALMQGTPEQLDTLAGEGWEEAPNLERTARWHTGWNELLVWYDGYWLDIVLTLPEEKADNALIYARAVATAAISNAQ